MKKRLLNSKRKLLSLIALGVLLAFIISSGILAFFTHEDINWDFKIYPGNAMYYYNGLYYDSDIESFVVDTEEYLYLVSANFDEYPTGFALYDKNGELVLTNGTVISFMCTEGKEYCFLDNYLTEVEFKKIVEFANLDWGGKHSPIEIKEFRYSYDEDGKVVPIYCLFVTYDNPMYESIEDMPDDKKLEMFFDEEYVGEERIVEGNSIAFRFYENKNQLTQEIYKKKYRELIELVKSEEYRNTAYDSFCSSLNDEKTDVVDYTNAYDGGNNYWETGSLEIDDELYFYVFATYYNPVIEVWDECGEWIQILALNFLVFGAVIIFVVSKYYDKNKAFEESKNAFISAMTHEMKTPIAIIQNQCECVLENIAPENNEEYLKSIYDETQKMDKLVTDMLQYNRIATNGKVNVEKCNLSDIVKEETEKYKKQFELHEKNVTLNLKETAVVKCDKNLIALVVDNMLSNTIKHTENGGEVIVTVKDGVEGYKFSVYNSGSTVPENEKDKIWSVLYKTDKSRTERDKSSGVGLAVSAKILDLHKANYGCVNVNDGVEFYFNIK